MAQKETEVTSEFDSSGTVQLDKSLGWKVHDHLVSLGIETPLKPNNLTDEQKLEKISSLYSDIMETLGLDLTDDSLMDTPNRVAKMYVREMFSGLDYDNFPKCTTVENKMAADGEFVCVKNIETISSCEHHLKDIISTNGKGGTVIAYIPGDKVLGLSKFSRVTQFFASRPQVQERLTNQIFEALKFILGTDDVAVYQDLEHMCMRTRGVKDPCASTVTCALGGRFNTDPNIRKEFIDLARTSMAD